MKLSALPACNSAYNQKGFLAGRDLIGKRCVRHFMRKILLAGEETQEGTSFLRDLVANRPSQHREARLQRVEHGALRSLTLDVEFHLAADARQRPQMGREYDLDHDSVCTSTDTTAGRSR